MALLNNWSGSGSTNSSVTPHFWICKETDQQTAFSGWATRRWSVWNPSSRRVVPNQALKTTEFSRNVWSTASAAPISEQTGFAHEGAARLCAWSTRI